MYWKTFTHAVLAAALVASASAQAKKSTVSDAQIQADVLKRLAADASLQNQDIQASVAFGTVTLTGTVTDDNARHAAEQAAAQTNGVTKVVDELALGAVSTSTSAAPNPEDTGAAAIAEAQNEPGQAQPQQYPPVTADQQAQNQQPMDPQAAPPAQPNQQAQPDQQPQYPQAQPGYPAPRGPYQRRVYGPYPYPGAPPQQAQGNYPNQQQPYQGGGQQAGRMVTVPAGTVLSVRINQPLDSHNAQPGMSFDGTVVADIVADGAIAIPRGATVHGQVANVSNAGALKGRGSLSLQLTGVSLGGQEFALTSEPWTRNGGDKAVTSVDSTLGGAAIGAIIGGVAGGGAGAAIGAGVGGGVGLGAAAASPSGNVWVPGEAVLRFRVSQPVTVATVDQQELNRLAYGAGPAGGPPAMGPRPYPYPYPYAYPYGAVVIGGPGPYFYRGGYYRPYYRPYYRGYYRY
ncbi:MAG: BON domain-containing protein [Acidobacteria bacterium]|nr:BON domain-containing protein [Acidobacteriota bacterium]